MSFVFDLDYKSVLSMFRNSHEYVHWQWVFVLLYKREIEARYLYEILSRHHIFTELKCLYSRIITRIVIV